MVKNLSLITQKDLRHTKIGDFCGTEHIIVSKIEPKVTRVDPKMVKKRLIYDIKLFLHGFAWCNYVPFCKLISSVSHGLCHYTGAEGGRGENH